MMRARVQERKYLHRKREKREGGGGGEREREGYPSKVGNKRLKCRV